MKTNDPYPWMTDAGIPRPKKRRNPAQAVKTTIQFLAWFALLVAVSIGLAAAVYALQH